MSQEQKSKLSELQEKEDGTGNWREKLNDDDRMTLFREFFSHMLEKDGAPLDPDGWLDGKYAISKWNIPDGRAEAELEQFKYRISQRYRRPIGDYLRRKNTRETAFKIIIFLPPQLGFQIGTAVKQITIQKQRKCASAKVAVSWDPTRMFKNKKATDLTIAVHKKSIHTTLAKRKNRSPSVRLKPNKVST